jgi:peptidoglycan/LPS O-acetylase OafA/YrhL
LEASRPSIGVALDPHHNSLNFLRLVMAILVIISHSVTFGLFDNWDTFNGITLGTIAVYGFFGISGYLIAGSAIRNGPGRYLWQRVLRILPAFWICLIVTAFGIGAVAWLTTSHPVFRPCASLTCYVDANNGPFSYLYRNWFLQINQQSIAGLPYGHYNYLFWRQWNGSLWTLMYEFLCYLMLMVLAACRVLRRRAAVLVGTVALYATIAVLTLDPSYSAYFSPTHDWFVMRLLRLASVFLVGTLIYLYRDRLPDSGWLALVLGVLFVASLWLPNDGRAPQLAFTLPSIFSALLVYPVLWLGAHLPFQRLGATNDYSYGFYIYAFPVQQLLAMWGVVRWGFFGFTAAAVILTTPFAVCSWWLIEKHALRLKAFKIRQPRPEIEPTSLGQDAVTEPLIEK